MPACSSPLPAASIDGVMPVEIREPIKVIAVFDRVMRPVKFKWQGRVYPVKEITHTWFSSDGLARSVHFAISDGIALFELAYDTVSMSWTLESVDG